MLIRVLNLVAALIYIIFGAILVIKKPIVQIEALWQTVLGVAMVAYGLFRLYRHVRSAIS